MSFGMLLNSIIFLPKRPLNTKKNLYYIFLTVYIIFGLQGGEG